MKFLLFVMGLNIFLFSATDDYLSNEEYGRRLFNNPRGIACSECHGQKGNGGILSAYVIDLKGKKKLEKIIVPKINDINISKFKKTFSDTTSRRYMPTYYLTKEELAYIYYYLQKIGAEEKKKVEEAKKKETKKTDSATSLFGMVKVKSQEVNPTKSSKVVQANITKEKKIIKKVEDNATDKNSSK